MRRLLGALLLVAGLFTSSPIAQACGDKLLILGRPLHFKTRPASILAYAPPGSALEAMLNNLQWMAAVRKGKHRVVVTLTPGRLAQLLKEERFDVVLVGQTESTISTARIADTAYPAVMLPVIENVSRQALRDAEKEYGVAVRTTAKSGDFLSEIDRAVGLHDLRIEAAAKSKKNQTRGS